MANIIGIEIIGFSVDAESTLFVAYNFNGKYMPDVELKRTAVCIAMSQIKVISGWDNTNVISPAPDYFVIPYCDWLSQNLKFNPDLFLDCLIYYVIKPQLNAI